MHYKNKMFIFVKNIDMKEKIEFLLQNKGLTSTQLARMLEIQPSGISHILSGRNKPSFDFVVKVLRAFPDLNPDWLLLDSEQIFRDTTSSHVAAPLSHPTAEASLFTPTENSEISAPSVEAKNVNDIIFSDVQNGGKRVERIIVLYADHTFDSYSHK